MTHVVARNEQETVENEGQQHIQAFSPQAFAHSLRRAGIVPASSVTADDKEFARIMATLNMAGTSLKLFAASHESVLLSRRNSTSFQKSRNLFYEIRLATQRHTALCDLEILGKAGFSSRLSPSRRAL